MKLESEMKRPQKHESSLALVEKKLWTKYTVRK
jgi:hypothetical protein